MANFLSCLLVLLLCVAGREYACISLQDVGAGGREEQILAKKVFFSFLSLLDYTKKAGKYMQAAVVFVISQVRRIRLLRLDRQAN
jgi:hypothetical protein